MNIDEEDYFNEDQRDEILNSNSTNDSTIESEFKCNTCEKLFSTSSSLKKHACKNAYSNKKRLIACEHCVKTFCTQNAYNRHLNANHFNKRIICNICGKEFKLKRLLMQHHYEEHTDSKIFQCEICKVSFSWKKNLEKHKISCEIEQQRKVHFTAQDQLTQAMNFQDNNGAIIFQSSTAKIAKPWICTICGKDFQYDFSFKAHMAGHDFNGSNLQANLELQIGENNEKGNEDEVEILVEVTNNGDAEIQMIQDSYQLNSQLKAFVKNTSENLNKSNESKNYVNLNVTQEKPFACEYCNKHFMWKMSLDGHIKQDHYLLNSQQRRPVKNSINKLKRNQRLPSSRILYQRDSEEEDKDEINDEEIHDSLYASPQEINSYSTLEDYLTSDTTNKDNNAQASKFVTGLTNILGNKQSGASQVVESIRLQKSSSMVPEYVLTEATDINSFSSQKYVPVEYAVEDGQIALYFSNGVNTEEDSKHKKYLISTDVFLINNGCQTDDASRLILPELQSDGSNGIIDTLDSIN